jgi:hypothetical protein
VIGIEMRPLTRNVFMRPFTMDFVSVVVSNLLLLARVISVGYWWAQHRIYHTIALYHRKTHIFLDPFSPHDECGSTMDKDEPTLHP